MKIPKREVVKFVIQATLRRKTAKSQKEFVSAINNELRKVDADYSITGKRLREISFSVPGVRVNIYLKDGPVPKRCPSCGSKLRRKWDRNLKGRKVLRELECTKCSYTGRMGKWAPARYRFSAQ
ncbi:MAG: hypothetical protein J7K54_00625 [Candidatus Aenigmarchaeota archaeon]|nr:hypothetical protein [Candidatus Aenigmarchaeota archaeon]